MELKKILSIAAAAAIGTAVFSSCGEKKEANSDEQIKLTMWTYNQLNAYLDNYDKMACFQLMQEENDVDIEFIHPVVGQQDQQFSVLLASGEYPDMIVHSGWGSYPGGYTKAIKDGVILDLLPFINEKQMPELSKWIEKNPEWLRLMKTYDGTVPVFAGFKENININSFVGPTIRKDWLDKLGLEMPETMDEWYDVLKAFKEGDPNGNGQADEIPFIPENEGPWIWFASAFDSSVSLMLNKEGKVVFGPTEPGFKDYLSTLHKWYAEGLVDKEYIAGDRKTVDYKMTADIGGSYFGYTGSQMGNYMAAKKGTDYELVAAPWPKSPDGIARCGFDGMIQVAAQGVAISTQNKYIDKTIEVVDWMYGPGTIAFNYGIEGETYNIVDGEYQYTDLILNNPEGKDPIAALAPYATPNWGVGASIILEDSYNKISRSNDSQKNAAKVWAEGDTSLLLPDLSFTEEETDVRSTYQSDLRIFVLEYMNKVIIGTESVDSFDNFVKELKNMGSDELVKVYQAAYDRYMAG